MDEVNILASMLAKKNGIPHTIARIRDPKFLQESTEYLQENFDIDLVLSPELVTAKEIRRILMTPAALNVGDFANGRVRLYETRIQRQSPYIHIPFKDLELPDEILAAMIFRDHQMIIPHGNDCLLPYDNAYFIGAPKYRKIQPGYGGKQYQAHQKSHHHRRGTDRNGACPHAGSRRYIRKSH